MRYAIIIVLLSATAWAHKPSDAHVEIAITGARLSGTIAVALRDLDGALAIDSDGNGTITWAEALAAAPRIDAYTRQHLMIGDGDAACSLSFGAPKLADFSDGAYWTAPITGECPSAPTELVVTYALLFEIDAQHRGIVNVQSTRVSRTVIARDRTPFAIELGTLSAVETVLAGASRVASSIVELAFLVCLLLPLALTDRRAIAGTVGAFVLAGTATLLLSAAELVYLPPQVAPIAVALSIAIAAGSNLVRISNARRGLAFELGVLHGLGYVVWLRDAGFATRELVPALSFSLGIAIAQLAFAAVLATALYAIRRSIAYRAMLWAGSTAAGLAAIVWTAERVFA